MANDHIALVLGAGKDFGNSLKSSNFESPGRPQLWRSVFSLLLNLLLGFGVFLIIVVFMDVSSADYGIPGVPAAGRSRALVGNLSQANLAHQLEREIRIACLIMTSPKSHKTKAAAVKNTWGRRCTKMLFITTQEDDDLDTLVIDIEEKYEHLWGKVRNSFKHMYENHLQDFDWFVKADDDTYLVMENLRYLLHPYSPDMPIWFGFNFKLGPGREKVNVYMSGGSGYVLSREALRRFGNASHNNGCKWNDDSGAEDVAMGLCLKAANVIPGDSRDSLQKIRFIPFEPFGALIAKFWPSDFWFMRKSFFKIYNTRDALSDYAVAFHYIMPDHMYEYEYLLYGFEVVGRQHPSEQLPRKLLKEDVISPVGDSDWD